MATIDDVFTLLGTVATDVAAIKTDVSQIKTDIAAIKITQTSHTTKLNTIDNKLGMLNTSELQGILDTVVLKLQRMR